MQVARSTRRLLFLAALLAPIGAWATAPTPSSLQIDCVAPISTGYASTPHNCDSLTIAFTWTCAGQTSYELQVSNGPTPTGSSNAPYIDTTGGSATAVTINGSIPPFAQIPVKGVVANHWRVRCNDGTGQSAWAEATFSYNTAPEMPSGLTVTAGAGGTFFDPYLTDTSATWHVGPGGIDNPSCGVTTGLPCATAAYVLTSRGATAGASVLMATGTYINQTLCVSGGSYPTATRTNPITIGAEPGQTPTITGSAGVACGAAPTMFGLNKPFYVLDGLTFNNTGTTLSVSMQGSDDVVKNCRFLGTNNTAGTVGAYTYAQNLISGTNQWWLNNTSNNTGACPDGTGGASKALHGRGVFGAIVRGNLFTGNWARAYNTDGGQNFAGSVVLMENEIRSLGCSQGAATDNYEGGGLSMIRNLVNASNEVRWVRSRWDFVTSNTIQGRPCVWVNDSFGVQNAINSNICRGGDSMVDFSLGVSSWDTASPSISTYNNYSTTTGCRVWNGSTSSCNGCVGGSQPGASCTGVGSACSSGGVCTANGTNQLVTNGGGESTVNPNLDGSFKITSTASSAYDAGDPALPVPVGGGSRIDAGRFEFGATLVGPNGPTGHYDYQPKWSSVGVLPRIAWTFRDGDNLAFTAGNTQLAYEVEIDTVNTFDSGGTFHPYCRSGKVASSSAFWDVPSGCNLASGTKYYFRVRTYDNIDTTNPGTWSDVSYAFLTSPGSGAICGNGAVESGETCDDGSQPVNACIYGDDPPLQQVCNATCTGMTDCASPQYCGDSAVNGAEPCDGALLNGHTCAEFGCTVGAPTCVACTLSLAGCTSCATSPTLQGVSWFGGGP